MRSSVQICCDQVKWVFSQVLNGYLSFLIRFPHLVLLLAFAVSVVLGVLGFRFSSLPSFKNPAEGFETRRTELSGRVLAWELLKDRTSQFPNASLPYYRRWYSAKGRARSSKTAVRRDTPTSKSKSSSNERNSSNLVGSPFSLFLNNPLLNGACGMFTIWKLEPQYTSQIVFEASSFSHLLSYRAFQQLCSFETRLLRNELANISTCIVQYQQAYSLASFITCFANRPSCSAVTADDFEPIRTTLLFCFTHRALIVSCFRNEARARNERPECASLPDNCRDEYFRNMYADLYYNVISLPKMSASKNGSMVTDPFSHDPIYTNIFLPMGKLFAARYKCRNVRVEMYDKVFRFAANRRYMVPPSEHVGGGSLAVVGMDLGSKLEMFQDVGQRDLVWGGVSLLLVFTLLVFYTFSIVFSAMLVLSIVLANGIAYFLYRVAFGVDFFPFMNLLIIVLVIGIGADDACVLHSTWAKSKAQLAAVAGVDESAVPLRTLVKVSLRRSTLSMFVTSLTTGVSFLTNALSNIIVVKCFGLFAGTLIVVNFFFEVVWLPATQICIERWTPKVCRELPSFRTLERLSALKLYVIRRAYPATIHYLRFIWIVGLGGTVIAAALAVFWRPSIRLPEKNALQLFRSWHPFEWYEQNAEQLFDFPVNVGIPVDFVLVFGVRPTKTADLSGFDPLARGQLSLRHFNFSLDTFDEIDDLCYALQDSEISTGSLSEMCWTERFIQWSRRQKCEANVQPCCNMHDPNFDEQYFPYCVLHSSEDLSRNVIDGPFFDRSDPSADVHEVVAFNIIVPSKFNLSLTHRDLREMFVAVEDTLRHLTVNSSLLQGNYFIVSDRTYLTAWYDLQEELVNGTPASVLTSLSIALVAILISTMNLRESTFCLRTLGISLICLTSILSIVVVTIGCLVLLDWHLGIVESTIITLTVGMSFDYTLHYAVAHRVVTSFRLPTSRPPDSSEVTHMTTEFGTDREANWHLRAADNGRTFPLREQSRLAKENEWMQCADAITKTFNQIGGPVVMAAITTFAAGSAMLLAGTMAYYQIGLFMMLIVMVSWVYSTFFFMSMMSVFELVTERWCPTSKGTKPTSSCCCTTTSGHMHVASHSENATPIGSTVVSMSSFRKATNGIEL